MLWNFLKKKQVSISEFENISRFDLLLEDIESVILKHQEVTESILSKEIKELIFFETKEAEHDVLFLFKSIGLSNIQEELSAETNSNQKIELLISIFENFQKEAFYNEKWSEIIDKEGATFYINEICDRIQERLEAINNPSQLLSDFNNHSDNFEE